MANRLNIQIGTRFRIPKGYGKGLMTVTEMFQGSHYEMVYADYEDGEFAGAFALDGLIGYADRGELKILPSHGELKTNIANAGAVMEFTPQGEPINFDEIVNGVRI